MNEISGKVYVNELFAAQRQLREAIWMFFAQRDDLAIHTVASAAYRILKDLKEKRGRNEAADAQFTGIFYFVRDYRRGTLPVEVQDDPEIMKFIKESADQPIGISIVWSPPGTRPGLAVGGVEHVEPVGVGDA